MILLLRRSLAFIATLAIAASLIVYALSFVGTTMDEIFRWTMFLHIGIFALVLPMYAVEYSAIKNSKFLWDAIWQGLPKWAVRAIQIGGILFAAHFVLFLIQSHAASPEIINREYVLSSHGHVVKELTESQYRWLKGSELRLFATGWFSVYLALVLYWWFPRKLATQRSAT